ncbi:tumor necrosis factor receptor superfamily member 23-like isoform X2 [Denticeps clupeoides]|uniref:tumor necrosis factor receptor superfamily member 23-like isoform X2 n=1 Tax=Denticeps clupeoides TaxID=299321 RepID=UPI0010A4EF3F|nr:tumor necrosis factor receptor superfamily member 23-like isoform X2 [Denticeps clupeoides]
MCSGNMVFLMRWMVLVAALLGAHNQIIPCPRDTQFQVNGICCSFCGSGQFIVKNCSVISHMRYSGCRCKKCSQCSGEGMKVGVSCTQFSDTRCECEDGYVKSGDQCQRVTETEWSTPMKILTTSPTIALHTNEMQHKAINMIPT